MLPRSINLVAIALPMYVTRYLDFFQGNRPVVADDVEGSETIKADGHRSIAANVLEADKP